MPNWLAARGELPPENLGHSLSSSHMRRFGSITEVRSCTSPQQRTQAQGIVSGGGLEGRGFSTTNIVEPGPTKGFGVVQPCFRRETVNPGQLGTRPPTARQSTASEHVIAVKKSGTFRRGGANFGVSAGKAKFFSRKGAGAQGAVRNAKP